MGNRTGRKPAFFFQKMRLAGTWWCRVPVVQAGSCVLCFPLHVFFGLRTVS